MCVASGLDATGTRPGYGTVVASTAPVSSFGEDWTLSPSAPSLVPVLGVTLVPVGGVVVLAGGVEQPTRAPETTSSATKSETKATRILFGYICTPPSHRLVSSAAERARRGLSIPESEMSVCSWPCAGGDAARAAGVL